MDDDKIRKLLLAQEKRDLLNEQIAIRRSRNLPPQRLHGLTQNQYDRKKKAAGNRCFICRIHNTKLELDHNHKTKLAREFLCGTCNKRLASLEGWLDMEGVEIVSILRYLEFLPEEF